MNLLLIEDNENIATGLIYAFKKNNHQLMFLTNVEDAKKYLQKNTPALIILDVSLPDGNGFDFYENVIKEKKIPVVFLTAKDDENDIVKGLNLGAEDYMTKPFSTIWSWINVSLYDVNIPLTAQISATDNIIPIILLIVLFLFNKRFLFVNFVSIFTSIPP